MNEAGIFDEVLGIHPTRSRRLGRSVSRARLAICLGVLVATGLSNPAIAADCNSNGQDDTEEILEGLADDCNGNWIPDECEYGARPMDLVFAIDVSGSMSDDIGFLIDDIGTLSGLIGTDDRVGIIEFINNANVRFPMSTNIGAFESSFLGMPTTGGGGSAEASDVAVKHAAGVPVACATGSLGGLRAGADKILVLFTDEEAGGCFKGSNPQGALEAAQAAAQAGIKIVAIAERSAPIPQMQQYATLTGGALLVGSSGDLAARIAVAVEGLRNQIDPTGDCNGNGIFDACELANGTATDCNGDGFLDGCQLGGSTVSVGPFTTPVNGASTSVFMPTTQPARTTVTLEITADADLDSTSEYFTIQIGSYAFDFSTGIQCGTGSASIAVPQTAWNEALGPEGVEVIVTSSYQVDALSCLNQMTIIGLVEGLPDLNRNAIPDDCEGILVFDVPSVFPTIAEAIATAPDGAWVQLAPGTYGEAVDFSGKAIVIVGDPADPASVILDGAGLDTSVVTADSGETFASVLRGVTVRGGVFGTPLPGDPATLAGGGLYAWETDITIEDCIFRANRSGLGGGVFARAGAVTFTRCVFDDNDASSYGGGVNLSRCFGALIDDCVFLSNFTNASGGGLHAFGGDPVVVDCLFESNRALQPGGGVSWDAGNQGPLTIGQCEIRLNDSLTAGGGLATLFSTTPPILVADSIVCDNLPDQVFGGFGDLGGACVLPVCDADGDGIGDCIDTELSVPGDYATITEAIAAASDGYTILVAPGVYPETLDPQGKAIAIVGESGSLPVVIDGEGARRTVIVARNETSQTRFENLVFANGVNSFEIDIDGNGVIDWWDSNGGGGFVYEASPTFIGCEFLQNDCTRSGGGIYIYGYSSYPVFDACRFEWNRSTLSGGGVSAYLSFPSFNECDFISNISESNLYGGGGLAITGVNTYAVFTGGRLEGNVATQFAGGAVSTGTGATLILSEVVVVGNESADGFAIYGDSTSPLILSNSRICGNIGGQVSGRVEDDGSNCISEVCDSDADGTFDCEDGCPDDPAKIDPGSCGCGVADIDSDSDGAADCLDGCPADPYKFDPGVCGCGVSDQDSDGDGTPDCIDDEIHVPSQFATISDAVAAAGDGVTIFLAPGTYQEAIDFAGKAITIEGDPANPGSVVLSGGGPSGIPSSVVIFQSGEGVESILRGVTIRDGRWGTSLPGDPATRAGGALFGWETSPTIEDCIIESNAAPLGGGAFFRAGAVVLRRCEFRSNNASSYGGGLNLSRCSGAVIEDCIFENNFTNASGGGFHAFGGSPTLIGCNFLSNVALQPGGGVSWDAGGQGPIVLEDCAFQFNETNSTTGGGVATLFGTTPPVELLGTVICDNDPDEIAGGYLDLGGNDICQCLADLSGDGQVNGTDLGLWLTYTLGPCDPNVPCPADLDGDGVIAGGDLGALLAAWGMCE